MARSVKKGPFIDKGIVKAVEKARNAWLASSSDQDLVAPFNDYA